MWQYTMFNPGDTENLEEMWDGTSMEPGKVAVGFFYSVFIYGAWYISNDYLNFLVLIRMGNRELCYNIQDC